MPEIRQAFENDLIDEIHIDLPWVEQVLAEGKEATLAWLWNDRHYHFINDVIAELEWWACFKEPRPAPPPPQPAPPPQKTTYHPAPSGKKKKVGRNAPCPCGSGRKFKHCCGKRA
jgi:hypothetical protein